MMSISLRDTNESYRSMVVDGNHPDEGVLEFVKEGMIES